MDKLEKHVAAYLAELKPFATDERKAWQEKMMRNDVVYMGVKQTFLIPVRRKFIAQWKKELTVSELQALAKLLWEQHLREGVYGAFEIVKYLAAKHSTAISIDWLIELLMIDPYWDTIDALSQVVWWSFKELTAEDQWNYLHEWSDSENIWMNRLAIQCQLKAGDGEVIFDQLEYVVTRFATTKVHYLQRSIGWVLRNIHRIEPQWIDAFLTKNPMSKKIITTMYEHSVDKINHKRTQEEN